LTFGRPALIVKLNKHLPQPLSDIRFSPAEWQRLSGSNTQSLLSFPEHPSYLGEQPDVPVQINPVMENSHSAIQDWARALARRSHHLPLCPECQCPTPVGEIERWLVCAPCAAKLMADPGF
jgi:predicted nucleic acid-binding Zn ribbon protein